MQLTVSMKEIELIVSERLLQMGYKIKTPPVPLTEIVGQYQDGRETFVGLRFDLIGDVT